MYTFQPQKKRSQFRIKLGCVFYTLKRYFYWIKYSKHFAKIPKEYKIKKSENFSAPVNLEKIKQDFPYTVFTHSSPLYRNLSKEDMELQEGKVHNLNLAHKYICGTVIKPGELFSYWKLIGNPTKFRGFKKGMVLSNGKPGSGIGGGLCALSNLLYWITLHSPLSVKERYRHSFDVFPDSNRTLPFGSGATCVYNYRDLMILNETQDSYIFIVYIENKRLCGELRSNNKCDFHYEVYEKEHYISMEAAGIYVRHNSLYRKTFLVDEQGKDALQRDDLITENHAIMMYNPILTYEKTDYDKK